MLASSPSSRAVGVLTLRRSRGAATATPRRRRHGKRAEHDEPRGCRDEEDVVLLSLNLAQRASGEDGAAALADRRGNPSRNRLPGGRRQPTDRGR
jgi:hypothetical protein